MRYRPPLNYPEMNNISGHYSPAPVKAFNNEYFAYWERALFQRAQSAIILDIPWSGAEKDFFYYCLFMLGYLAILEPVEYGLIFQPCTLSGYDIYYQPTKATIANAALTKIKKNEFTIHETCEILKLTPDYLGIWDIISHYAEKLAGLESAVNMSIINSRLGYILGARTKAAAEALKKIMDKISRGEPTVVADKRLFNDPQDKDIPFQFLERKDLKTNYLTTDQLNDLETILNMFDNEIGIVSLPYQKKERMVKFEAESTIMDATSRASVWNTCLNESFEIINAKYGTSMSARLRYDPTETGGDIYG